MVEQKGRHLDFADAVADAVHTCEMRAKQLDDLLRTFMFVIPRVSHTCCWYPPSLQADKRARLPSSSNLISLDPASCWLAVYTTN